MERSASSSTQTGELVVSIGLMSSESHEIYKILKGCNLFLRDQVLRTTRTRRMPSCAMQNPGLVVVQIRPVDGP